MQRAQALLSAGMGREAALSSYQFATDGRHFVPYNLTMIGYAASEESQAHVVDEYISIPKMLESLRGMWNSSKITDSITKKGKFHRRGAETAEIFLW